MEHGHDYIVDSQENKFSLLAIIPPGLEFIWEHGNNNTPYLKSPLFKIFSWVSASI